MVVLDPTGVAARTLARVRDRIAAGEVRRRTAYGHPYWIHVGPNALVDDYLRRGRGRLRAIEVLLAEESWADVVRESQEVVEIALKALLRFARIDVPRIHDVSPVLDANRERLPSVAVELDRLISISRRLRRDRELAFYGSEDLTPSQFYRSADAQKAYADAALVHRVVAGGCNRAGLA